MKIYLSLLISLIFLLNSCSVSSVKFSAIQPADITIPDHINKFMVFDRVLHQKVIKQKIYLMAYYQERQLD